MNVHPGLHIISLIHSILVFLMMESKLLLARRHSKWICHLLLRWLLQILDNHTDMHHSTSLLHFIHQLINVLAFPTMESQELLAHRYSIWQLCHLPLRYLLRKILDRHVEMHPPTFIQFILRLTLVLGLMKSQVRLTHNTGAWIKVSLGCLGLILVCRTKICSPNRILGDFRQEAAGGPLLKSVRELRPSSRADGSSAPEEEVPNDNISNTDKVLRKYMDEAGLFLFTSAMDDEESVSSQCNLGSKMVIKVRIRTMVSL